MSPAMIEFGRDVRYVMVLVISVSSVGWFGLLGSRGGM